MCTSVVILGLEYTRHLPHVHERIGADTCPALFWHIGHARPPENMQYVHKMQYPLEL